jgi:hypothetical protein
MSASCFPLDVVELLSVGRREEGVDLRVAVLRRARPAGDHRPDELPAHRRELFLCVDRVVGGDDVRACDASTTCDVLHASDRPGTARRHRD